MKIAYITHYSRLYGANKSLLTLIIKLRQTGEVSPLVICRKEGDFTEKLREYDIPYKIIPFKLWIKNKKDKVSIAKVKIKQLWNFLFACNVSLVLKKEKIDLIHTNSLATNFGGEISKLTNIKHIWHFREFLEEDYNLDFEISNEKAFKFISRYSNQIVCISKDIEKKFKPFLSTSNMKLIYNGIEIEGFHNQIPGENSLIEKNKFNLVIVGNISEEKGQLQAVKAIKYLVEEINLKEIKLNLIGDGEGKELIEEYVRKNKLEKFVEFWGYRNDIHEILRFMDAGLMCSKREAFGRTTVEYMASETPVIGARSGATKEIIEDKVNGLLYNPKDYKDLAEKINLLYKNNNDLINKLKGNALSTVKNNYTSDKNAENILTMYKEIL
ncbi:glycosyltransferase family 4 protein [Bacillus sp. V3]|nr:glycosyltransferase family 4 protein [Bacillus sp. V3]